MSLHGRRRLTLAAVVALAVAAVLALTGVLGGSSAGTAGRFVPGGAGAEIATVAQPAAPPAPRQTQRRPFRPAAAAIAAAGSMPLTEQVAQLFVVAPDAPASPWGGYVTSDPAQLAGTANPSGPGPLLAATQPPGAPRVPTPQAAQQLKQLGYNMVLAPPADVDTPGGPLTGSLFSTDPQTVARLARASVGVYAKAGLIAAPGHFPGEGGASADPDQMTATVGGTLPSLQARDLVPFATLAHGAPVIVLSNASYAAFDGVTPAGLDRQAIQLLRTRYGFTGVTMSDDLDATLNATGEDPGQTALQALNAGEDLIYVGGPPSEAQQAYTAVLGAAERSARTRTEVRAALLHDLTLKAAFDLLP